MTMIADLKEHFEVTHTGLYKTRNGRKVFVSFIKKDGCIGVIEGEEEITFWDRRGLYLYWDDEELPVDIVSEWED